MTVKRPAGLTVKRVDAAGPPIDIDRWVERYVEIGLEVDGIRPSGSSSDVDRRMGPSSPAPTARSR